ncbi:nucleoside monophosphate kinase [endosymbiont of Pachyrhynchus infernalis]|uniref:adenylate kinase family protein n=1 Tax=endosymbiont of Pachyrhynchus infernalis TaxID=1971488 RepID=UPI000DC72EC5|nr:nucleoside monophosphate kinase [endosymbiont of Pachyrhynchus infernalis]BBA84923.1 adenylate kinase [endosymbiont of Pachyrhynchus infernalis]
MNIILIGPPGSGKGTQSKFIINKYNLLYISVGDLLRNISLINKDDFSLKIKNYIDSGKLLNDDFILSIINNYITKNINNKFNGILLDGFPRNLNQAYLLDKLKIKFNIIIEFIIDYKLIINRLSNRLIHEPSGRIYNNTFNPPLIPGFDDITGEKLSNRIDDNIKTIKDRLNIYNDNILDLRKYFFDKINNDNDINYYLINSGIDNIILKNIIYKILFLYKK